MTRTRPLTSLLSELHPLFSIQVYFGLLLRQPLMLNHCYHPIQPTLNLALAPDVRSKFLMKLSQEWPLLLKKKQQNKQTTDYFTIQIGQFRNIKISIFHNSIYCLSINAYQKTKKCITHCTL